MSFFIIIIASILLVSGQAQSRESKPEENTFVISEQMKKGDDGRTSSEKFDVRARGMCRGDFELIKRVTVDNKVNSTIRCAHHSGSHTTNSSAPLTSQDSNIEQHPLPKETFARLRLGIGLFPTCSGEQIGKSHLYCGEKYSAALAIGPGFNTRVKLNHYSLHKAASKPRVEENATKWRKEEMFATSLMVSQGKDVLGFNMGIGIGYFGSILIQRDWIEYPFPRDDDTIAKERGRASGLAMELYIERNFVETGLGNFNIGLTTSGLFPSSTSNPRIESKYWALPSLEMSWQIDLKK